MSFSAFVTQQIITIFLMLVAAILAIILYRKNK